jgi:hypothetical protein
MARVGPDLALLYDEYAPHQALRPGVAFQSSNALIRVIDARVVIDAVASGDASTLKSDLERLGMQEAVAFGRIVSGQLPIAAIRALAGLASLNFARPASAFLHGGQGGVAQPPGMPLKSPMTPETPATGGER